MKVRDLDRALTALLFEATSLKPLAILRIGTAAILLVQGILFWWYRELLVDDLGPVPWRVSEWLLDPLLPRLSYLVAWLAPLGFSAHAVVTGVLAAHLVGATLLLVGYGTRAAAILTWVTYLFIRWTSHMYFYGIGGMLLIALFYCMFMPVGREWALDGLRRRGGREAADPALSILVLRIHLCIVYAAAGLSKAVGDQWWSGDAILRSLSLPRFQQFDPGHLLGYPLFFQVAAIGAIAIQLAYPVLVWTRVRALIVLVTELLHLAIAVFLGLWLFSAVMIVLNAAAFGETLWRAAQGWIRHPDRARAS